MKPTKLAYTIESDHVNPGKRLCANNELTVFFPGTPDTHLIPYKSRVFKAKEFSDMTFEFVMENGMSTAMKQKDPSGEYVIKRK